MHIPLPATGVRRWAMGVMALGVAATAVMALWELKPIGVSGPTASASDFRTIAVALPPNRWSEPFAVPACTGWTPYPDPGKTVEVVAADDGEPDRVRPDQVYSYGPGKHADMSGKRGPFYFRSRDGGNGVKIGLTDNTYCYRAGKR